MPTINQLSSITQVSGGDQLPIYVPNNGDARKVSVSQLLAYFQTVFAAPTVATNLYTPGTGFNITVPTPVSEQQWMILQPAGTLATGTITLPLNTGTPDGTQILITSTQEITALTLALNGATAIYGAATSIAAGTGTSLRFYAATNSWYEINSSAYFAAGVQAWLATPSSANLRTAVTDETGTGSLVFGTSPTLTTPVIAQITNTGTLTLPTSTDTLVGRATTDTLTNKSINLANNTLTVTSAQLATAVTDETGSGSLVFATSPTLVTPALGTVASGNISACTSTGMALTSPVLTTPVIGVATGTSLSTTGNQVISGAGKIGYATGAGGGVLQATSKATGVTLNNSCGQITMDAASLAANTTVSFALTNSIIEAGDVIIFNHISGGTLGSYTLNASCASGSATIYLRNITAGALAEAVVLRFAVTKVVDA